MDESFRKAVASAIEQINPTLSKSCPFLDLVHPILSSDQEKASILDTFVVYSKAPPVMMYIKELCFYAAQPASTQMPKSGRANFLEFFTPQSVDIRLSDDEILLDEDMYEEYYISADKDELVDDVLRNALLQAAEQLEERFGSLCPSPLQLLIQSYSVEGDPQSHNLDKPLDDQTSIDLTFSKAIQAAVSKFIQIDHEKSGLQFMDLLICQALKFNSPDMMAIGERILLACVPYPEKSAGSDALSVSLYHAVLKLQSELQVEFPIEALIAAIDRLPADKEVKLMLQFIIVEMIEKPHSLPKRFRRAIGMGMKFKVPRSIEQEVPQSNVQISLPLLRRLVNMFSKKN